MSDCGSCSGGCSSCSQGEVMFGGAPMMGGSSCQSCQQNGMAIPATPGSEYSTPAQPGNPTPSAAPEGAPAETAPEPTHARMMQPMQMIQGQPMQMQPVHMQPMQMQQMQPMQMQSMPPQSVQMQPLQVVPQQTTMQPQVQSQRTKPAQTQPVRYQEWMPMTPMTPNQMPPGMQTQIQGQSTGNAVQPVLWVPAQGNQPQAKAVAQPQNQFIYEQAPLQTTTTAPLLVPAR